MTTIHIINGDAYVLETIERRDFAESIVITVEARWVHDIYKTTEKAKFTLIMTSAAEDVIVNGDGGIAVWDENNEFHQAFSQHCNGEA